MLDGRKNVLEWFEGTGFAYWFIYHQGKTESGNYADKSSDAEIATPRTAYHDLEVALQRKTGNYTIIASATPKQTPKGNYREDFRISLADAQQPQAAPVIAHPNVSGVSENDIERRISDAVDKAMTAVELKQLREENARLKSELGEAEASSPMNRIGSVLADILPAVLPSILSGTQSQPTARVAGLNAVPQSQPIEMQTENITAAETVETVDDVQSARLEKVIGVFMTVDPDGWLDKLEKLAIKVQGNPGLLNMVNML